MTTQPELLPSREEFERFATELGYDVGRDGSVYASTEVQLMWVGYRRCKEQHCITPSPATHTQGEDSHHMVSESDGSLAHAQAVADAVGKAEAHGDVVKHSTQFSSYEVEFFGDDVSYVKADTHEKLLQAYEAIAALHQPTEDVKEAYEEGWRNGNSHQGNLEYPYMTMQYDWNVSESRDRARPVGGEK